MSDDGKNDGRARGEIAPEERDEIRRRASEIGAKLDAAKSQRSGESRGRDVSAEGTAIGLGFRFLVDLLVGILAGGFLGWLLDRWVGPAPLFMIVLGLLGFVAGLRNVFRAAKKEDARHPAPPASKVADDDDDN